MREVSFWIEQESMRDLKEKAGVRGRGLIGDLIVETGSARGQGPM